MLQKYGSKDSSQSQIETEEISNLRRVLPQLYVAGVENLILLGWGLTLGYPSILINGLQNAQHDNNNSTKIVEKDFKLTTEENPWIDSIFLICITLGCVSSGLLMDSIGKRRLMQILNILMLVAWALVYFASDSFQINIGLCISRVCGGLLVPSLLIYIAETVQQRYRDILIASGVTSVLIGVFLQFFIGQTIVYWHSVALISAIFPILGFIGVFFLPETPYWLCKKYRNEQALESLQYLRGWARFEHVTKEFQLITSSIEDSKSKNQALIYTVRNLMVPFFLILFSFACGHFSGIFSLYKHVNEIFDYYHIPIGDYRGTFLLGSVQVLGCIIGTIFVQFVSKRRLVFFSMIGCCLCFGTMATHYQCYSVDSPMIELSLNSPSSKLQSSFENFEYSFLKMAIIFRDTIDENALETYGSKVVDINDSSANKLTELIDVIMIASSFTLDNLTQATPPTLSHIKYLPDDSFLNRYLNTLMSKQKVLKIFTINEMINKTFAHWNNHNKYNSNDLLELMNVTKAIVQTSIQNEIDEQTIFAFIDNIIEDIQLWNMANNNNNNNNNNTLKLIDDLNDLSWMLSLSNNNNLTSQTTIELPILARDEIAQNQNWLLLILLLSGSLFSHVGIKLLPWMLIGEVYPMKLRNMAAGISCAMGYLIGFISCELFSSMVHTFTMNGIFWFYSAATAVGCITLYFILPD